MSGKDIWKIQGLRLVMMIMNVKSVVALLLSFCSLSLSAQVTHVTLTYYNPVKTQCDDKPLVTADGSIVNLRKLKNKEHQWCAVSRDLLWLFPKGKPKRVYIEGFGVYEVRDKMHARHNHRIDILLHPSDKRKIFKKNVKVRILK